MKNITKGLAFLLAFLCCVLLLCGCARQMEQMPNEQAATRFSVVDEYARFQIVVDLDTGVMYSMSTGGYSSGTLTLLVNWDGSPRCYPGFDAREDRP